MILNDNYRIVIGDSRVTLPIMASPTDDSRGIIYNRTIVQDTGAQH